MFDFNMWVLYLVYIQAGLLVGAGLARVMPKKERECQGQLRYGEKGRHIVGVGLSVGLQLYIIDFYVVWTCSAVVSLAWSVYPKLLVYIDKKIDNERSIRFEVNQLRDLLEEKLNLTIDMSHKDFKGKSQDEATSIIREKITVAKNGHDKKDEVTILSSMTQ